MRRDARRHADRSRSAAAAYVLAVVTAATAVLLRWLLDPMLGDRVPFAILYSGVAVVVWVGGYGPALLTAILGYVAASYLFIPPRLGIALEAPAVLGFAVYLASCLVIIGVGGGMRSAQRRIEVSLDEAHDEHKRMQQQIAERERAERTLQKSEAALRSKVDELQTLLDILPGGVLRADAECRRITGNRAFYEMLGIPRGGNASLTAEQPDLPPGTRVLRDGRELPPDELPMQAAGRTGRRILDFDHDVIFPDGRRVTLLANTAPLLDERGNVRGVLGAYADITARKRAEEALRKSEQWFRQMADSAPVLIWMSGPDKARTWLNRPWLEFVGRSMEQELGNGRAENVHPDDSARCLSTYVSAFDLRQPFAMEYRLRRHDRTYRWVLDNGVPLYSPEGAFTGYIGSCIDIDDRKRAEEEIQASDERLAAELEAMTRLHALSARLAACDALEAGLDDVLESVIVTTRADFGNIQLYDPAGKALRLAVHRGFGPDFLEHFRAVSAADGSACGRALASGDRVIVEDVDEDASFAPHRRIAAAAGFRAVQSTILKTRTGGVLGMLSTHLREPGRPGDRELRLLDLHAGHAADLIERLRSEEGLREADRRKDEFLATLAHELRNPLAPIRNAVELLRRADGDASVREYARNVMERQVGQLVRLIDDLLDSSRVTMGKLPLRKEQVELSAVVQSALEASRPHLESGHHQLTVTVSAEPILLEADPTRLSQVVSNLLNNAAKYTEKAGHVWLTAGREGEEAVISVRDTGVGIEPGHLPSIFEMFSQVAPALERSKGGLGIGLSLVRGIVELHGGRVEARSAGPGKGSEFVVRLPVVRLGVPAPEPRGEAAAAVRPCRILVVDDNRDAAESLALMLRLMGHEVETAGDGLEAVQAAAASRPDLLLLDIGLPGMNGYEAARQIRQQPWGARMPLIALTGWGQDADRQRSREAGFDHHLTKPVDVVALRSLLDLVTPDSERRPPAA